MSNIHVLATTRNNTYQVVVHASTPAGNNSAGVLWSDAIKFSGRAITVMTEGTGAGQISTAEKTNVLAGTVIEGVFEFEDDPAWNNTARNAAIDLRANNCIAELQAKYSKELKFFGAVR